MFNTQRIVIQIMGGRNFKTTGTKFHVYIFIFNNRNFPVYQRNEYFFTFQMFKALIIWIDTDSSIGHYGFGPGCGNA